MLEALAGKLLVASPLLVDPNFARAVVLVCQYSQQEGAFGLVLNRPLEARVAQYLPEWQARVALPPVVFQGGPVDASSAFALARNPGAQPDAWSMAVLPGLGLIDLRETPDAIDESFAPMRLYSGYAGWSAGQLEGEIAGEGWFVVEAQPEDPFTSEPQLLWQSVLRRQRGALQMFSLFPPDPSLN